MEITLRFALKSFTFIVLLTISIVGPLREAFDDYLDPGTKTRKSTEIVSFYKSPAFTFCFSPPFNSSSNLEPEFFTGQKSDYEWHYQTPMWDLFHQSAFVMNKDFDILLNYDSFVNSEAIFHDKILQEGITTVTKGKEVETITLPSMNQGMCHVLIPKFDLHVNDFITVFFKFKSDVEKPDLVTVYVSPPNDWSMIGLSDYKDSLMYQFDISKLYSYVFSLKQIEFEILEDGNEKCDYGCRIEQCEETTFDNVIKLNWTNSTIPSCFPILLKGPYYQTHKFYKKCQNFTDNHIYFMNFFLPHLYFDSLASEKDLESIFDCAKSKRSARYTGTYQRYASAPGDQDKDLKVSFRFPSREMVKEQEERFVTHLQFFVEFVGSLGAFIDFCLQSYINRMIDFGFKMLNSAN